MVCLLLRYESLPKQRQLRDEGVDPHKAIDDNHGRDEDNKRSADELSHVTGHVLAHDDGHMVGGREHDQLVEYLEVVLHWEQKGSLRDEVPSHAKGLQHVEEDLQPWVLEEVHRDGDEDDTTEHVDEEERSCRDLVGLQPKEEDRDVGEPPKGGLVRPLQRGRAHRLDYASRQRLLERARSTEGEAGGLLA